MLEGFKNFLMQGNVVQLAVGVIIGGAFGKIVDGFMKAIVEPIMSMLLGGGNGALDTIKVGPFPLGILLSAIVNFIMIAGVVYFFIVQPFSGIAAKMAANTPPPPDVSLLTEIRDELRKR